MSVDRTISAPTPLTLQAVADVLRDEGRDRYTRVLTVPAGERCADALELLESAERRIGAVADEADRLVAGDAPVARAQVAWALATTHRALASQALTDGIDPAREIDEVVAGAHAHASLAACASPHTAVTGELVRGHAAWSRHALSQASRSLGDDHAPNVPLSWTRLAAHHLLILHVLASESAQQPGEHARWHRPPQL